MSMEYPCIFFEKDGKCRKFSGENTTSYCVMGPCPEQKLSNADRIRAMDDEQLAKLFYSVYKRSCIDFVNQSGIKAEIKFKNSEGSEAAFLKYLQQTADGGLTWKG